MDLGMVIRLLFSSNEHYNAYKVAIEQAFANNQRIYTAQAESRVSQARATIMQQYEGEISKLQDLVRTKEAELLKKIEAIKKVVNEKYVLKIKAALDPIHMGIEQKLAKEIKDIRAINKEEMLKLFDDKVLELSEQFGPDIGVGESFAQIRDELKVLKARVPDLLKIELERIQKNVHDFSTDAINDAKSKMHMQYLSSHIGANPIFTFTKPSFHNTEFQHSSFSDHYTKLREDSNYVPNYIPGYIDNSKETSSFKFEWERTQGMSFFGNKKEKSSMSSDDMYLGGYKPYNLYDSAFDFKSNFDPFANQFQPFHKKKDIFTKNTFEADGIVRDYSLNSFDKEKKNSFGYHLHSKNDDVNAFKYNYGADHGADYGINYGSYAKYGYGAGTAYFAYKGLKSIPTKLIGEAATKVFSSTMRGGASMAMSFAPRAAVAALSNALPFIGWIFSLISLFTLVAEAVEYATTHVSPIILDLNGDGVKLFNYKEGVYFDYTNSGFATRTGWISEQDGFLALDINKNGIIDSIAELFGNDVIGAFFKLSLYDSNHDGVIDIKDSIFSELLVWQDKNKNGFSEKDELKTLEEMKIKRIFLNRKRVNEYVNQDKDDTKQNNKKEQNTKQYEVVKGNIITEKSSFEYEDGTLNEMIDVLFENSPADSIYIGNEAQIMIENDILFLPNMKGFGAMPELWLAMTKNDKIKEMVKEVSQMTIYDPLIITHKIEEILYLWAGANNIGDKKSSKNFSVKKKTVVEKFTNHKFMQRGASENAGEFASEALNKAFFYIENTLKYNILIQGTFSSIFPNAIYYVYEHETKLNDSFNNIVKNAKVIANTIKNDYLYDFWLNIARIANMHKIELSITTAIIKQEIENIVKKSIWLGDDFEIVGDDGDNVIYGTSTGDIIKGMGGNDKLYGDGGDDNIKGGEGNDRIYGGDGNDRIYGNNGDDELYGEGGRDFIYGGKGNDKIYGGDDDDVIDGGEGADEMDGGLGSNTLSYGDSKSGVYVNLKTNVANDGDASGDVFRNFQNIGGSEYDDTLIGDSQNNVINGEGGNDKIYGGDGNDYLFGAKGEDWLFGENGNDLLMGFDGIDHMDGGPGSDTVSYNHPYSNKGVCVNLTAGIGQFGFAEGDTYKNIENVVGSPYNDTIIGDHNDNILNGAGGADIIDGQGGIDTVDYSSSKSGVRVSLKNGTAFGGDAEGDTLINIENIYGSDYDDILEGLENKPSIIYGGKGINKLYGGNSHDVFIGGEGQDIINGRGGLNTVTYHLSTSGVLINLLKNEGKNGFAEGDSYENIINIVGSNYDDKIIGNDYDNTIKGGKGNDVIYGGKGNDILDGGDGDNILYGEDGDDRFMLGQGNNVVYGGNGKNTADYSQYRNTDYQEILLERKLKQSGLILPQMAGDLFKTIIIQDILGINVNLQQNIAHKAHALKDNLHQISSVIGSNFNDHIIGDDTNNVIDGLEGDDYIDGGGGNDVIILNHGKNQAYGGAGNDLFIVSSMEANTIDGGTGQNLLQYNTIHGLMVDMARFKVFKSYEFFDTITNIYAIKTGDGDDIVYDDHNDNVIYTNNGNDKIFLSHGNDKVNGGKGNDIICVNGAGNKEIYGGADNDIFVFTQLFASTGKLGTIIYDFTLPIKNNDQIIQIQDKIDLTSFPYIYTLNDVRILSESIDNNHYTKIILSEHQYFSLLNIYPQDLHHTMFMFNMESLV